MKMRDYPLFIDETVFDTMTWYQGENPEASAREAWRFAQSFHRGIAHRAAKQQEFHILFEKTVPIREFNPLDELG